MKIETRQSYLVNGLPPEGGEQDPLATYWPAVFDPKSPFSYAYGPMNFNAVKGACERGDIPLVNDDIYALTEQLYGQQVREYNSWQVVLPFESPHQEMFIVLDGSYVRMWGRVEQGKVKSILPAFQPIQSGFISSPTSFLPSIDGRILGKVVSPDPKKPRTVEMVVCIKRGCLIHVNNALDVLKMDSVSKVMARSRDNDARWLQQSMFALQSNEDRVKSLVKGLIGIKSTVELEDDSERATFKHPFSQSALAECLDMSDNTLRPYLKTANFEWFGGKMVLNAEFTEKVQAEYK